MSEKEKPKDGETKEDAKKPKEGGDAASKKTSDEAKKTKGEVADVLHDADHGHDHPKPSVGKSAPAWLRGMEDELAYYEHLNKGLELQHKLEAYRQKYAYTKGRGSAQAVGLGATAGGVTALGVTAPYLSSFAPFSYFGMIPGVLAGGFIGYKAGDWMGRKFGDSRYGKYIGTATGGITGGLLTGSVGTAALLAAAPTAVAGATIAGTAYLAGRLQGRITGSPPAGVLKTMGRGLLLPFTLAHRGFRKFIADPLNDAWEGFKNGVVGKKRHGWIQHLTGTLPAVHRQPYDTVGAVGDGLTHHKGRLQNHPFAKGAETIRNTIDSTVSAPKKAWNWLWADRGGGHGGGHGGGNHH